MQPTIASLFESYSVIHSFLDCSVVRCDAYASHLSGSFVVKFGDVYLVMMLDSHAHECVSGDGNAPAT